jgi:hypothetical protein
MSVDTSKIGLAIPGLTLSHGTHSPWEAGVTMDELAAIVRAADRLGYSHIQCAEHIGVPASEAPRRGARYYDPLATFGYFSAITGNIRFLTAVLVLGYHHPLEIAKRYGTLDVVSGGSLICSGWAGRNLPNAVRAVMMPFGPCAHRLVSVSRNITVPITISAG